jgi:hypothetical protein
MQVGKGDLRSQRQRRRDRYRGCRVCGVRGAQCTECKLGAQIVAIYGYAFLSVIVDGSFVESSHDDLGHGGAGLVLVCGDEILASRTCGFRASSSSDAEFHAVIRASRWAPGVAIYTDARDLPVKMVRVNPDLAVHYLDPNKRADAYALAHRLSVEGRCREAPETIPAVGLAFAAARSNLTKSQRKAKGADLLLEAASRDPNFDGDFTALAERLGLTSGRLWQRNPSIQIAMKRWLEHHATIETPQDEGATTHEPDR